jgi:hypothetical protein
VYVDYQRKHRCKVNRLRLTAKTLELFGCVPRLLRVETTKRRGIAKLRMITKAETASDSDERFVEAYTSGEAEI